MATKVQHITFEVSGWIGDPGPDGAQHIVMRGALEYPPDCVLLQEDVSREAIGLCYRYRKGTLPREFWEQPLSFKWNVSEETWDELSDVPDIGPVVYGDNDK